MAVVTDGAGGLGEACARRFAADGARVRFPITAAGGAARSAAIDVTDDAALDACAERIRAETGAPEIFVTSAGILETVSTVLAVELGRHGVRVNGVAPTYVITPGMRARIDKVERDPATIRAAGALDMLVRPANVADVVAFLCSERAAAITGVMLPIDAGYAAAVIYKSFAGGVPWRD